MGHLTGTTAHHPPLVRNHVQKAIINAREDQVTTTVARLRIFRT
jgi:hypothetical protein